jgi:hypothetical protein
MGTKYMNKIFICTSLFIATCVNYPAFSKSVHYNETGTALGSYKSELFAAKFSAIDKLRDAVNSENIGLINHKLSCDNESRYGWICRISYEYKDVSESQAEKIEISSGYGATKEVACGIALHNATSFEGWVYQGDVAYIDNEGAGGTWECSLLHKVAYNR